MHLGTTAVTKIDIFPLPQFLRHVSTISFHLLVEGDGLVDILTHPV
jgi:hypothetical protein